MINYYIVSDIHSSYKALVKELTRLDFNFDNEDDKLVILGDAFDRGSEPIRLLELILDLIKKNKLIYIKGNHEERLFDILEREEYQSIDRINGTIRTILSFYNYLYNDSVGELSFLANISIYAKKLKENQKLNIIKKSLVNYKIIDKFILVHSYVPLGLTIDELDHACQREWSEAMWSNPFKMNKARGNKLKGYTIIGGHMPFNYDNDAIDPPLVSDDYININSNYFKTKKLYIMKLEVK